MRYYLQDLLWQSSVRWIEGSYSDTNFIRLADRIETWRYRIGAQVAYVTFNYDLLLDSALSDISLSGLPTARTRSRGTDIEKYVNDSDTMLFKVHGSVNWARGIRNNPTRYGAIGGDQRSTVLQHLGDLDISDPPSRASPTVPGTPSACRSGFTRRTAG